MELKEARYILAIARHQSIGKAAESLYISQPSLSKYLKNLEERLGAPLFSRHENRYYPTYMGERYLHYAEQIVACGDEWMQEYDDIAHRQRGRLNIAVPIMMGSTLIEPMLAPFHKRYPYVTLNIMEAVNFIAENSLETSSIDLTLYNIHEFPETMDYQILRSEEIVLVLHENHPLAAKAITRLPLPVAGSFPIKRGKLHSPLPGPEHRRHRPGSLSRVQHQPTGLSPHEKLLYVDPSGYGRRRRCLRPGELFPP